MMKAVNAFAEGLGTVAALKNAGQGRNEGRSALPAAETPGMDYELSLPAQALQVPCPASVSALASQPMTPAFTAANGRAQGW